MKYCSDFYNHYFDGIEGTFLKIASPELVNYIIRGNAIDLHKLIDFYLDEKRKLLVTHNEWDELITLL